MWCGVCVLCVCVCVCLFVLYLIVQIFLENICIFTSLLPPFLCPEIRVCVHVCDGLRRMGVCVCGRGKGRDRWLCVCVCISIFVI